MMYLKRITPTKCVNYLNIIAGSLGHTFEGSWFVALNYITEQHIISQSNGNL